MLLTTALGRNVQCALQHTPLMNIYYRPTWK